MKNFKKALIALLALSFVLAVSCATTAGSKTAKQKASLEKTQERMLWKISGTDKNGEPSTVYVQGTIHLGDDRLVVSDNVKRLFLGADRRIGEIASEDYPKIQEKTIEMMIESAKAAGNKDFRDELTQEQNAFLENLFPKETLAQYALFEPWVTNLLITSSIMVTAGLDAEKALDSYFVNYAAANGLSTQGLDKLETQLDFIKFGDWNDQMGLLSETIDSLAKPEELEKSSKEIIDMYEAYINDDVAKTAEVIDSSKKYETAIQKRYNKMLWEDRNAAWAKLIEQYLNDGGTTFIFAGTGHFVGKESVFTAMQKNKTLKIR